MSDLSKKVEKYNKLVEITYKKPPCYCFIEIRGEDLFLERQGIPQTKKEALIFSLIPSSDKSQFLLTFNEILARAIERDYIPPDKINITASLDDLRDKNCKLARALDEMVSEGYVSNVIGLSKTQEFILSYAKVNKIFETKELLEELTDITSINNMCNILVKRGLLEKTRTNGAAKYRIPDRMRSLVNILLTKNL